MATSGEDDKSCPVCLNSPAQKPRLVPCGNGHVFCLDCLKGLVDNAKNVENNTFPCPCCRTRVPIPVGGVSNFPSPSDPPQSSSSHPFSSYSSARSAPRPWQHHRQRMRQGFDMHSGPSMMLPPGAPPHLLLRSARNPFYPPGGDLEMDGPQPFGGHHYPGLPFNDHFPRRFNKQALPVNPHDHLPPHLGCHHHHHHYHHHSQDCDTYARRSGGRRGVWQGRGSGGHAGGSTEDLDMAEVMLLITQMEEAEQQGASGLGHHQHQQQRDDPGTEQGASGGGQQQQQEEEGFEHDSRGTQDYEQDCEPDCYRQDNLETGDHHGQNDLEQDHYGGHDHYEGSGYSHDHLGHNDGTRRDGYEQGEVDPDYYEQLCYHHIADDPFQVDEFEDVSQNQMAREETRAVELVRARSKEQDSGDPYLAGLTHPDHDFSQSQLAMEEKHQLELALAFSQEEQRERAELQRAMAVSKQEEDELQMAILKSAQEQEEKQYLKEI